MRVRLECVPVLREISELNAMDRFLILGNGSTRNGEDENQWRFSNAGAILALVVFGFIFRQIESQPRRLVKRKLWE